MIGIVLWVQVVDLDDIYRQLFWTRGVVQSESFLVYNCINSLQIS